MKGCREPLLQCPAPGEDHKNVAVVGAVLSSFVKVDFPVSGHFKDPCAVLSQVELYKELVSILLWRGLDRDILALPQNSHPA